MRRLAVAHLGLFGAQLASWLPSVANLAHTRELRYPHGLSAWLDCRPLLATPALIGMTAAYVALAAAFARGSRPILTGLGLVLLLALVANLEESMYPGKDGVHHGKLMPAAVTLAWVVAWGMSRGKSELARRLSARDAMAGAAASCYLLAGFAKLHTSGLSWVASTNLRLLVAERAVGAWGPIATLRNAFANGASGRVAMVIGAVSLACEVCALALLHSRTRRPYACLLIAMHFGIGLLMGYHYFDWILVLAVLALPDDWWSDSSRC